MIDTPDRYRNVYFHKREFHSAFLLGSNTTRENRNQKYLGQRRPSHPYTDRGMSFRYAFPLLDMFPLSTAVHYPVSAIAWALVYSYSPFKAIELGVVMILRDYLLVGMVVATILW